MIVKSCFVPDNVECRVVPFNPLRDKNLTFRIFKEKKLRFRLKVPEVGSRSDLDTGQS
jgi:hypothetical protein